MFTLILGCSSQENRSPRKSTADWAASFVVWNGDLYEIQSEEVDANEIEKAIGKVTHYSDYEGTYSDGFSNKYPVGTKLYKMKNIETSENIAIEIIEGQFIKAKDIGKYKGK